MSMLRASSAVRFSSADNGKQGKGMGARAISLPSLVPGKGYPVPAGEKQLQKKTPSELLVERRDFGVLQSSLAQKPQITGFLDLSQYSNYTNSVVPVDQPLFSVHPPVITFSDFEGLQTYEATITLRNQDCVARRVKVYPPNSPFFDLAAGRGQGRSRKASPGSTGNDKVAPGMEVSYVIRFKPDARIDYSHDLVVITEREKFSVPIRASGGSALLDFPDTLDFGANCVVGHQSEKTVLVRNIGDRATKFVIRTSPPFSVAESDGYLPEGASCQVDILFKPEREQSYEGELHLKYGELEAVAMVYGSASNAEVSLSHSHLIIDDTYVGLETQGVVIIRNNSDVPVDFSWRLFPTIEDEEEYRVQLQGQLKHEEREENLYMMQDKPEDDSSDDSGSDDERLKVRREAKINSHLSRKYGNIHTAVREDPMLFHDATFSIEPSVGKVWSHSQLMCSCSFKPKEALVYSCTAYLQCVGQEERAPLVIKGLGIGPKASFSYDELDVSYVFVESAHRYEVQLINQGDICVDFSLVPRETTFGSRFQFEPSSGTIPVGGQCEITVNFKPTELGDFHEVFDWVLKGSAIGVTLAFKGKSIQPSFDFDVDRIPFGIVSYGFLNSRMLTLSNTAEVPMRYTLRVLGDDPQPEFDIVPGRGTLLPNCSQRVQIDFVSKKEQTYNLALAVDLEGVGNELKTIPITAQCAAPQVTFEPHGCLSYGDVFIRYPFHQSLYLHNTSNLPAKFEVMPQEDKSRAEFEPDQWSGSVPPCASHVITVTLTAHAPGPVRVPMYVRIPGRAVPFPLVLVANSIGPRVVADPLILDWGPTKCLQAVTRHVKLTNNSCIDASVRAFMNERKSLWSVHPKVIHLSPQETLQLAVTLNIDEACPAQDVLNLIVSESLPQTVTVKGKGIDTPVVSEEPLEIIDFGTLFTTHEEPREIVIKNFGQCARRINWFRDKEKTDKKDKNKEPVDKPAPVFRVEPDNVIMEPKSAYRFTFYAESPTPGFVEETLVCNETLDKGGGPGKQIFKPTLTATFVAPQLKLSTSKLEFNFFWSRDHPVVPMREPLVLENTGPLEVGFRVQVTYPFQVDEEDGVIPPHGSQQIMVEFDPGWKTDRKTSVKRDKLIVRYDEHPAENTVELSGKVVWPNLDLDSEKVDFGIVLNETTKSHEVELKNPTPLTVSYNWCLAPMGRNPDEMSNPRGTPGATQTSAWSRTTPQLTSSTFAVDNDGDSGFGGYDGDVDVNRIFDILPIFGQIPPNGTQKATITYYGLRDKTFRASAICMVEGGPEYALNLRGSAAPALYGLDKQELDFGEIPFTEVGEQSIQLANTGKVPAAFNFNCVGMSRSNVVEIFPSWGTMKAGEKIKVNIRFRAGIPDLVQETVVVEVGHLSPSKILVRGSGTFPGIVLGLPRQNEEEHKKSLYEARRRMSNRLEMTGTLQADLMDQSETATGIAGSVDGSAAASVTASAVATVRDEGEVEQGEPSPRSAISEETQSPFHSTRRQAPGPQNKSKEDLDLELEVDRHFLCEFLLKSKTGSPDKERSTSDGLERSSARRETVRNTPTAGRSGMRSTRNTSREPLQVTAAYYYCDFGHIALGQIKKQTVSVYNCCSEPVFITLDKKQLRDNGFIVEPENISKLPPRQMTPLTISATRPREEEGLAELAWDLPVKGGPNYRIQLTADWVLPDLVMSSESLDFGRLLVGQRKRITLELRNQKAVPVEWSYVDNHRVNTRSGSKEPIFDLFPPSGVLEKGASTHVVVSFTPTAAQQYSSSLQLRIRDNKSKKVIHVFGRGDVLKFDVQPSNNYELGPVMPNDDGCQCDFRIVNPTEYPIEVYSVDFDNEYLEEENTLCLYDDFTQGVGQGSCEVPVRQPGDGTWKKINRRVEQIKRQKAREEAREEARAQREQNESGEPPAEETQEEEEEEEIVDEDIDPDEMDPSPYPYRVPAGSRLNALLVGPPKCGISTVARSLARAQQRRALHIDEVFDWALKTPKFLHSDWKARKIVASVNGGQKPTASETAHLLKRRVELPDCNAGVILDGIVSSYLQPSEVVDSILEALGHEKLAVFGVSLPLPTEIPEGQLNPDSSVTVPVEGEEEEKPPHPFAEAAAVLDKHYEALIAGVAEYANELRTSLPDLENACKAAADAVAAAEAAAVEGVESEVPREVLDQAVKDAQAELDKNKAELEYCEQFAGWTPEKAAEMFPQPPPHAPIEGEEAVEVDPLPPGVIVAEGYSKQFQHVQEAVEKYNLNAEQTEEDRLRGIDRKKREKRAAQLEAQKPRTRTGKAQQPIVIKTPDGPPPGMEKWVNPVTLEIQDLKEIQENLTKEESSILPFKVLFGASGEVVPSPLIPEEKPLPLATVVQVISPPTARKEREPLSNFKILTPTPPTAEEIAEYEAAKEAALASGEPEPEYPKYKDDANRSRWIIDPLSEQVLKVHFSAKEVETYGTTLTFESVDDQSSGPVSINVTGVSALPGISNDPLKIFPKCRKKRPPGAFAVKAFVTSLGIYDFGPLLAGREMSARFPTPIPREETSLEDPTTTAARPTEPGGEETLEAPEPLLQPVSVYVMRHSVDCRITNNSLFEANVKLNLGSASSEGETSAENSSSPFVVEPSDLQLSIGESKIIKVWCFPPDKGTFEDTLVANIEHNPEPVTFGLCALGCVPWATLSVGEAESDDKKSADVKVNFGRSMEKIRAEDKPVRLKNESAVPVRWQLICRHVEVIDAEPQEIEDGTLPPGTLEDGTAPKKVPEEFSLDAFGGLLGPFEERNLRIGFRAMKAASYNFVLGLEVQDNECFREWKESGTLDVRAETFAVKVEVDPDPREGIIFGPMRVGETEEKKFAVVNKGLYPVRYVLKPRGKSLMQAAKAMQAADSPLSPTSGATSPSLPRQLLAIDAPEGELPPGESKTITVKCTPGKAMDMSNDRDGIVLQIFDIQSGEQVDHKIPPMRVVVTAVHNQYQVTPPRGLNFGPVERDNVKKMEFTLRNIGQFPYEWCLFDPSTPPVFSDRSGSGGPPQITDKQVDVGPFTVTPTFGTLQQGENVQIEVVFKATGDQDFDCRLAMWVDGVQGDVDLGQIAGRGMSRMSPPTLATLQTPGTTVNPTCFFLLTGQSCIPGINTTELQTVFEEQFYARTLEDAIAIAGRSDLRCFCELDKIFHFGPVLAYGNQGAPSVPASPGGNSAHPDEREASEGVTERFRLENPKSIPCKVNLQIKPKGSGDAPPPKDAKKGAAAVTADDDVFTLDQKEVILNAHDSQQIEVTFKPPRLASFSAELVATVEGGSDPKTNCLAFELRGDGAVPSVSLEGPSLFGGEDGGELKMGKLALGRCHEVKMNLRNSGLMPATVRVEPSPSPHFSVSCPTSLHLGRGGEQSFAVVFQPRAVGPVFGFLNIRTMGNPFEDVSIKLQGEGYSENVAWDLTETHSAAKAKIKNQGVEIIASALPPEPDHLDLGEVAIGSKAEVKFKLVNKDDQILRYEFPLEMPLPFGEQLVVKERAGFVQPNSALDIALQFQPTAKLEAGASPVSIVCQTFAVTMNERRASVVSAASEKDNLVDEEPPFTEIENTRKEVPLKLSAMADEHALKEKNADGARGERTDLTEINFKPTMMFASKSFRFVVENSASISALCGFQIQGDTASSFTVTPSKCSIPANGEKEIEVKFSPKEVEHFDCTLVRTVADAPEGTNVVKIPLAGAAKRPWCHIELPPSDYGSRRQSDTPLDPRVRVVEIVSLGTQIKNTKRFYVLNPTSIPIHFEWRYVPPRGDSKGDDDSFRCLTKSGEIRPDKKFEMVFEFAPLVTDTKESFWRFLIMGPVINGEKMKIEETFLLVGMVEEPRVGTDSPAINFGERLIDGETVEKVRLVNKEHIPFSFSFDESSFKIEGQPQVISVSPISGVVGPDTSTDIEVTFKPVQERAFNFNVVCNVKRKKEPVVLNVKGVGYQIHASLSVEESDTSGRRILQTGVVEALDFGVLQVKEFRQMKLYLKNDSRRNFNFRVLLQSGAHRRPTAITSSVKPPYLDIAHNDEGVARHHEETEINIKYAPKDVHRLDGSILHIVVPSGSKEESFMVQLIGGAKRSRVEFSFYEHNFGPCFIANAGTTMAGVPLSSGEDVENDIVKLIATNRDDSDVLLSSTFERLPYLHVHMDDTMIPAGGQITIPIIFSPVAEKEYDEEIVFKVNEYTPMTVKVRGRGCPLRLELTDLQMQNIDFGMTTGGKAVSKRARLVNRSARAVTFTLSDESEHLTQRSVTWNPTGRTTLRPRDTLDVDLRFMPNYKISPFRHPLFAKCDHGVDVRLMQIAGSCHATEVRLSELCVFFSDVVVGSQASRVVKLHNFGDLGSKFRFEMPSRYQGVFTISPAEGFVRPQEEIPLTFTFHPTLDRVREFQRKEASVAKKKIGSGSAIDVTITVKDIRCVLDGHSPLTLEATGNCIDQPREAQRLDFVAEVRKEQVNSIKIKNPTDMDWKLTPTIYMSEPAGTSYWSCPSEVVVAKGKEEEIKIVYRPLTMTELPDEGDGTQPQKAGGQQRCAKHRGNLFIGTPDGKAILYSLEGEALRPKCDQVINERVACKKQHTQSVKVKNWLQARQRFDVQVELIDPAPGTRDAQSIMIRAVDTLDLPAGLEREYKFSVYAYRERPAKIMVNLVSRETGEYKQIEVNLEFFAAESLATINLEAACRQQTRHKISVANPLDTEAKFKSTSTNPYITFSQDPLVVPPNSEKAVDVLFRPVEEGRDTAAITLQSDELGTYPYTVKWIATPAGLDRTLVLKAPLGGSSVEEYKFMHYAQQQVAYSAVVEPVPGHKSPPGAFSIVTGQDLNKPAADSNGTEVSLAVQFRPSILGESKALLVVKGTAGGAQCGEYKALLTGFAQPPQPQGPFTVPNGKGEAKIEFRNPFDTDTNFKFQVDNAAFNASQKEKRMGNGETCQITVQFKSDKPQSGRLIISTDKVSTPWIFFLRGEL